MASPFWSPEEDIKLRKLWGDGLSAALCSEELPGRSRNAIVGRVYRLRLPSRPTVECNKRFWLPRPKKEPRPRSEPKPRRERFFNLRRPERPKVPAPIGNDGDLIARAIAEGRFTKCPTMYAVGVLRASECAVNWNGVRGGIAARMVS